MDSANKSLFGSTGLAPVDSWYSFLYYPGSYSSPADVKVTRNGDSYYISRLNDESRLNAGISYFVRTNSEGQWDNVFTITNGGFGSAYYAKIGSYIFCATTGSFSILNEDLSVVWSKLFTNEGLRIKTVETDSDGNIYIGANYRTSVIQYAALVICLNSSGVLQWCKRFSDASNNVTISAIKKTSTSIGTNYLCVTVNKTNLYYQSTSYYAHISLLNKSDGSLVRLGYFYDGAPSNHYFAKDVEFDGNYAYVAGYVLPNAGGYAKAWTTEYEMTNTFAAYPRSSSTLESASADLRYNAIKRTTTNYKCVGRDLITEHLNNFGVTSQYRLGNSYFELTGVVDYSGGTYAGDKSKNSVVLKNIDGLTRPRIWSDISLSATTYTEAHPTLIFTTLGANIVTFDDFASIAISNHTPAITQLTNELSNGSFVSNASNSY